MVSTRAIAEDIEHMLILSKQIGFLGANPCAMAERIHEVMARDHPIDLATQTRSQMTVYYGPGVRQAAQRQPRRISSAVPGVRNALTSCPSAVWNARPLPTGNANAIG